MLEFIWPIAQNIGETLGRRLVDGPAAKPEVGNILTVDPNFFCPVLLVSFG